MKNLSFLSLILVALVSFTACEDSPEDLNSEIIIGNWQNASDTETPDVVFILMYHFYEDKTFEISGFLMDLADDKRVLGYTQKAFGTYALAGNRLNINLKEVYQHTDTNSDYSDLKDLVLTDNAWSEDVMIQFQENNYQLIIDYPNCGPAESCHGRQIFQRPYSPVQTVHN